MSLTTRIVFGLASAALSFAATDAAFAQKKYDPAATDTEIKIGNTSPHSGPASAYAAIAKAQAAHFRMINDRGGINANDYRPIEQLQMVRFTKDQWELLGPILSSENKPM